MVQSFFITQLNVFPFSIRTPVLLKLKHILGFHETWGTDFRGEFSVLLHNGVNLSNMFSSAQNDTFQIQAFVTELMLFINMRKRFKNNNFFLSFFFGQICSPASWGSCSFTVAK